MVGRPDAAKEQDIQLLGLGIMSEHCVITIEASDVFLTPLDGARLVYSFLQCQAQSSIIVIN